MLSATVITYATTTGGGQADPSTLKKSPSPTSNTVNTGVGASAASTVDAATTNTGSSFTAAPPPSETSGSAAIPNKSSSTPRATPGRSGAQSSLEISSATSISPNSQTNNVASSSPNSIPSSTMSTTPINPTPSTTSIGVATGDSSSPRLQIILPVVFSTLLISVIFLFILFRRRHLLRRQNRHGHRNSTTTRSPIVVNRLQHSTVQPYDLKTEYPLFESTGGSDSPGPVLFPGESSQDSLATAHDNPVSDGTGGNLSRLGSLFTWLPWYGTLNDHQERTQVEPYDLKSDLTTISASNNEPDSGSSNPNSFESAPSLKRPLSTHSHPNSSQIPGTISIPVHPRSQSRSSSESSIISVTSNTPSQMGTQTGTTPRQIRLLEEADVMRSQLVAYQRDALVSAEEMRRMRAHIQMLEMQLNSDWARELTDDPPPTYQA
ncbi:hypothetical protein D9758_017552 [Tetrapyrgos nigripes]|uniref:Transmembrane protein n=1 Tax=Tetrapyrgos nigripes TaxID=182062 RepID=A0A8H5C631_9AGAR|nr:hypothetical protein D9758_017552 [Tetrapyrgos nigripes]